ncbi:MAG: fibronectin type III domain-containing protein, partial [Ruminococcus bovis]
NTSSGVNVSWKKVSGAKSYKVYRKAPGAKKYSVVKKTNSKTVKYLDKKVSAGKTYSYQVVAVKGKETSKSKTKSITRLLAPKNVKVQSYVKNNYYVDKSYIDIDSAKLFVDDPGEPDNNVMGIKITWTKSKGANKYDIYRKIVGGKFEKIKTTGNTSAYVDEDIYYIDDDSYSYKVKKCYYKVVARRNKSTSSSSTVRKITYIDPRKVSAESYASGMFLGWGYSVNEGIDGYKIYRSTNGKNGKYSLIAKLSKNTLEFTDKNVEFNKTYYYKIVAYKGSLNSVAIITKTQYKPMKTVNVSVGATDDSVKKSFEKAIKRSGLGDTTVDDLKPYLRFTSLNKKIATISRDFVVTGVSKGQVKAKFDLLLDDKSYEAGFILINVN